MKNLVIGLGAVITLLGFWKPVFFIVGIAILLLAFLFMKSKKHDLHPVRDENTKLCPQCGSQLEVNTEECAKCGQENVDMSKING